MVCRILEMMEDDAKHALKWAGLEGRNPGLYDRKILPAIAPEGCFDGYSHDETISINPCTGLYAEWNRGKVKGYAAACSCFKDYKFGLCFADSPEVARRRIETIFAGLARQTAFIDVPDVNKLALVKSYDIEPCFARIRMYTTDKYQQYVRYVFGDATFEVGR